MHREITEVSAHFQLHVAMLSRLFRSLPKEHYLPRLEEGVAGVRDVQHSLYLGLYYYILVYCQRLVYHVNAVASLEKTGRCSGRKNFVVVNSCRHNFVANQR